MIRKTSSRADHPEARRFPKPETVALVWRRSSKDLIAIRAYRSLRQSLQSCR